MVKNVAIADDVELGEGVILGSKVIIWSGTCVREGASIGAKSSLGRSCYVGPGVRIGANCSLQNQVQIFEPAIIGNNVFIGPGTIITNDPKPRAINSSGERKREGDWEKAAAVIKDDASIGAGVICVGGIVIGSYSMIGAGSVVTRDVKDYQLVAGSPARHLGWVGRTGHRLLERPNGILTCPDTGENFTRREGGEGIKLEGVFGQ